MTFCNVSSIGAVNLDLDQAKKHRHLKQPKNEKNNGIKYFNEIFCAKNSIKNNFAVLINHSNIK